MKCTWKYCNVYEACINSNLKIIELICTCRHINLRTRDASKNIIIVQFFMWRDDIDLNLTDNNGKSAMIYSYEMKAFVNFRELYSFPIKY